MLDWLIGWFGWFGWFPIDKAFGRGTQTASPSNVLEDDSDDSPFGGLFEEEA